MSDSGEPCERCGPSKDVFLGLEAALHDDSMAAQAPPSTDWLEHAASCAPCAAWLRLEARIVTALRTMAQDRTPPHALPADAVTSIVGAMVAAVSTRSGTRAAAG